MSENPAISIVTPTFNSRRFIGACIENVAGQGVALEHIIVDGASTDGTPEMLKEYASQYKHLRVLSEPDRGQSDALNKGWRMAKGAIIGILNVDDDYEPHVLSEVVRAFERFKVPSFYAGNCKVWDDAGALSFVSTPSRMSFQSMLRKPTVFNFPVNPSAYFYHRSVHDLVGDYDADEEQGMDMDFLLRLFRVANLHYVDRHIGNFRLHADTKTHKVICAGQIPELTQRILNRQWARMAWYERWRLRFSWWMDGAKSHD